MWGRFCREWWKNDLLLTLKKNITVQTVSFIYCAYLINFVSLQRCLKLTYITYCNVSKKYLDSLFGILRLIFFAITFVHHEMQKRKLMNAVFKCCPLYCQGTAIDTSHQVCTELLKWWEFYIEFFEMVSGFPSTNQLWSSGLWNSPEDIS